MNISQKFVFGARHDFAQATQCGVTGMLNTMHPNTWNVFVKAAAGLKLQKAEIIFREVKL